MSTAIYLRHILTDTPPPPPPPRATSLPSAPDCCDARTRRAAVVINVQRLESSLWGADLIFPEFLFLFFCRNAPSGDKVASMEERRSHSPSATQHNKHEEVQPEEEQQSKRWWVRFVPRLIRALGYRHFGKLLQILHCRVWSSEMNKVEKCSVLFQIVFQDLLEE